ncbi:conserved hypothetical protein [Paraburkholderia sabiae]|nr:conserved hypothetical protein [Paraburkholderia sabiae]
MARILASENDLLKRGHAILVQCNMRDSMAAHALDARSFKRCPLVCPFVSAWHTRCGCREFASFGSLFR